MAGCYPAKSLSALLSGTFPLADVTLRLDFTRELLMGDSSSFIKPALSCIRDGAKLWTTSHQDPLRLFIG
jgi:hypothetical protein